MNTQANRQDAEAFARRAASSKAGIFATGGEVRRGTAALAVQLGLVRQVIAFNVAGASRGPAYEQARA